MKNRLIELVPGILISLVVSLVSYAIASLGFIQAMRFSSIVIAIVVGLVLGNVVGRAFPQSWKPGLAFVQRWILRTAIVFFGFRVTFQQIGEIGAAGVAADLVMLSSTFIIGYLAGTRLLKLDRDSAILCAAGSSICGAAAVLATEPLLKSEPHKVSVAVGTVVLFGTISMFVYPLLFQIMPFSQSQFGIYIGSSVHEVAQVVAAGEAVGAAETAVVVKLGRVMLLAPFLLLLSWLIRPASSTKPSDGIGQTQHVGKSGSKLMIPWFAFLFVAVSGFHSLHVLPAQAVGVINSVDGFLLTMAMAALGIESRLEKFKAVGMAPVLTAGIMFVWLIVGGFAVNSVFLRLFA